MPLEELYFKIIQKLERRPPVNSPQQRRRRVEIMIDNRLLGFLKPTPVSGPATVQRKRDSLEFLLSRTTPTDLSQEATDKAS